MFSLKTFKDLFFSLPFIIILISLFGIATSALGFLWHGIKVRGGFDDDSIVAIGVAAVFVAVCGAILVKQFWKICRERERNHHTMRAVQKTVASLQRVDETKQREIIEQQRAINALREEKNKLELQLLQIVRGYVSEEGNTDDTTNRNPLVVVLREQTNLLEKFGAGARKLLSFSKNKNK